ncbi:hypothetical protein UlMin_022429 [Ulmus minor]
MHEKIQIHDRKTHINSQFHIWIMALLGHFEILIGILSFTVLLIHHYIRNKKAVVPTWPVLGMLPTLLRNVPRLHDLATDVVKKSEGLTLDFKGPWFTNMDFLLTSDPSNVQHIFSKNFANYPKGPEFKEVFEPFGDGMLNTDSDLWKLQKKMFQVWNVRHGNFELFVARNIRRVMVADGLIPFLDRASRTGTQIDLQEAFQRMITFDNAFSLIMGLDPTSRSFKHSNITYQKAFEDIEEATLHRHVIPESIWKLQRWLQIGCERKLKKALQLIDEFLYECIAIKRDKLSQIKNQKEEAANFDMLSTYLEEEEKQYSDKFLRDVAITFLVAARDTINAGLTWFFWLIATHPFVETKILQEIEENLSKKDEEKQEFVDPQELKKLVYLEATLLESLRLYPPVPFNHKMAAEDDILPSGHHVKRKQKVLICFYAMGRMEEIWGKDCLEFKPERWISGGGLIYVPSHKFTTFNSGPRTCIGKDIALVQMKVIAVNMLRNYRLEVVEGHHVSPCLSIVLQMKHGLKVRVYKR